jgi:3-oxoacyl-[acyl-carrier-protein] synthase II
MESIVKDKKKRIVVTGMGLVSCYGNDVNLFYDHLLRGQSGISSITGFPCENFSTRFAGEIKNFDPGEYIDKKTARRADKVINYAIVAGKKALEHAGLAAQHLDALDKTRCGIIAGTGIGGIQTFYNNAETHLTKGCQRISPFFIPYTIPNMPGALLGIDIGFMGPNYSVSTACATGNYAIISGAHHIERGDADLMLCGGTEAPINAMGLGGFCAIKALSERNDAPQQAARPWDKDRDGFVMGEGAGFLVLESLDHALKRGATIYAEYLGGAFSNDAYHMTEPHKEGLGVALAMKNALKDANISPERVNYVNAHATCTPAGDMAEVEALKKILPDTSKVVINATKSLIGHSLGAAGALEAIATICAINTGKIHPSLNVDHPEEGLNFIVPKEAYDLKIDVALSNSFGFGGHNASLILAPYKKSSSENN